VIQRLTADLWRDPEVIALVSKATDTYRRRRDALLGALAGHDISAIGRTGFNVWIPVEEEALVAQALLERGWGVAIGAPFRLRSAPGLRVTTSRLQPADSHRFADDLAEVLRPAAEMRRHA
jgi:DNA-binding transcriptional MocR family regulator